MKQFSPWVFATYGCTCACPYCMVPKMETDNMSMRPETFEKMLQITEKVFEKGTYDSAHFRLSGGEPLMAFKNYKDLVTQCQSKYPQQMTFGLLTNLTIFTDEIIEWMLENNIGMQVSLDDLVLSKQFNNGSSSANTVLDNLEKAKKFGVRFSINTVLDANKTDSLKPIVEYICKLDRECNLSNWGLNGSYTLNDPSKIDKIIEIFKEGILHLEANNFDIYNKLRFYNSIIGKKTGGCSAGSNSFAIGTNLEIWPCQSMCSQKPLTTFSEDFDSILRDTLENAYFYHGYKPDACRNCSILDYCRGGCKAVHTDKDVMETTCRIRRDIITFILQNIKRKKYYNNQINDSGIVKAINDYVLEGHEEVETPSLD